MKYTQPTLKRLDDLAMGASCGPGVGNVGKCTAAGTAATTSCSPTGHTPT